ncbi:hypothetical protein RJ641_029724 [Dillenia turbinata]|uniref:Uncharacterized protein n=1 Tax=Dillenia turbinata TaxID=194707 RepID=A0AAN8VSA2_9MAGN
MENRRRSKDQYIGRSRTESTRCRRHPKHRQAPGVCSKCLSERLSQLSSSSCSTSGNTLPSSSSSSSLSSYSSSSGSSCSSPIRQAYRIRSVTTRGPVSIKNALTKSRSMAFITKMGGGETSDGKKKRGFWSKLLPSANKRKTNEDFVHSKTMKEIVTNRVM